MSAFVIDSSILASWVLADEANEENDALQERALEHGIVAPALLPFEIANVLIQAEKRGRIKSADIAAQLQQISKLPLEIVSDPMPKSFASIVPLAQSHKITSYDAAYLELSMRRNLPLATTDKALRRAAEAVGTQVLPD